MSNHNLIPDISIIIVNYKSWQHLDRCLDSLEFSSEFAKEVIVVDNHSNDGKIEEFRKKFSKVEFVLNTGNNGFANGCNLGAQSSKGKFLFFLNPDTVANQNALESMWIFAKENPTIGIISCLQRKNNGVYEKSIRFFPKLPTLFGFTRAIYKVFHKERVSQFHDFLETEWVSGSAVFLSREWFEQIGGWNEDYWMYYEDIDLCKRVSNANGKVAVLKKAEILHSHGGASRINMKTASLTKTEVLISKHVYIHNHFKGIERIISQCTVVVYNLAMKLIMGILGILLFFIPKMRLNVYLLTKIIGYYFGALVRATWLSPNSMNLKT